MARSDKRRTELETLYGDNAFPTIHSRYIEQARERSARYILFVNKDNKHGYCEKCCHDVEFPKTKHKEMASCPNCGDELMVQHTWRKTICDWNVDWYVVGELVDEDTFALRYIMADQSSNYVKKIEERAREIYDFKHGYSFFFSNIGSGWTVDCRYYLTEFGMGYRRKQCCIGAESLNNIGKEMKGITALKYFDQADRYFNIYKYPRDNLKGLLNAPLYEKMEKVGLGKIAMDDYKDYWKPSIKYKRSETSLIKMLGLDKPKYNLLLNNKSRETLDFIRSNKDMPMKKLEFIINNHGIDTYRQLMAKDYDDEKKKMMLKYLIKQHVNVYEYTHYLDLLEKLGYDLKDKSYIYPKDFRKEDERVSDEYLAKTNPEEFRRRKRQNKLIKKISDGLRNMPDIKEFLGGSNGLLVYVPESVEELRKEGRLQHNCIGTYAKRFSEGKTLVFFVRRIDKPNEPFVDFEYCNGEVVQCRYDHNKTVDDDKIIDFVEKFAERLRKNNVLTFKKTA